MAPHDSPRHHTADRPVLTVSQLAGGLRGLVEDAFGDVWVEGELSNFKRAASGHCYFTLKDADAQLRCVMWRAYTQHVFFQPQDGLLVRIHGDATVYEARGDLQLVARSMQLAGEGALQRAFEALKRRLAAEGLFDYARKRALPPFPEAVGVVTSGEGAALRDILSVLEQRFPSVRVLVCPVQVQGLGAAAMIAEAIEAFNAVPPGDPLRADVLIVGRGGGSAEDLWAFNEEAVARAIAASDIPVVSAVGHETDVSIADFVADVRAATPTMAATLVVPDGREIADRVRGLAGALRAELDERILSLRQHVRGLTRSYAFNRPLDHLRRDRQRLAALQDRMQRGMARLLERRQSSVIHQQQQLELLHPVRALERGYVRVERDGHPLRTAGEVRPGDRLLLRFLDGDRAVRAEPEQPGGTPPAEASS